MMLTPFVYLIRIAAIVWLVYFIWKEAIPNVIKGTKLNHINWWHDKKEPFLTNCSFVNALFCWLFWPIFIIYVLTFCLYGSMFVVNIILAPFYHKPRQTVLLTFELLWDFFVEYITGYNCYQLKRHLKHTDFHIITKEEAPDPNNTDDYIAPKATPGRSGVLGTHCILSGTIIQDDDRLVVLNYDIKHYALASEVLKRFKNEEFKYLSYRVGYRIFSIDFVEARHKDKMRIEKEER